MAIDNLAHYCEICGYTLPEDAIEPCSCVSRQDSVFWTNHAGHEQVWVRYGEVAYQVVRNGEMKVVYTNPSGVSHVLRYTEDLDALFIDTDDKVSEMDKLGDGVWLWVDNPWFEVWDAQHGAFDVEEFYSEPIDTLDEAVAYALELHKEYLERTKK
jgi:hypothetical protein